MTNLMQGVTKSCLMFMHLLGKLSLSGMQQ